jgi:GT2 family glycosyltransferase
MTTAANSGQELVLGTVLPGLELPRALRTTWLAQHQLQEQHPHIHGANLGIRADTYLAIGGWRRLAANEDVDLVTRAVTDGIPILRTADIPVLTSARMVGRAPDGFSSYLRHLRDQQAVHVRSTRYLGVAHG